MKLISPIILAIVTSILFSCNSSTVDNNGFPILKGPYLGQELPGTEAKIFAQGIVSDGMANRDVAINQEGTEMYFGLHSPDFSYSTIICSKQVNGTWTEPEVVSFAQDPRYIYLEPALSPDGQTMYFLSNMPKDSTENPADEDIWAVDRQGEGWGQAYNLGYPINTSAREFFPSVSQNGNLYFTRGEEGSQLHHIYCSEWVDGQFAEPLRLPEQVNCGNNRFNASVAPDESFMVVPAMGLEDNLGGVDYYIVFKNEDGTWQEPINMGDKINSPIGAEWSLYVSPNMDHLFFMASHGLPESDQPQALDAKFFKELGHSTNNGMSDIYWIDASILEEYRK